MKSILLSLAIGMSLATSAFASPSGATVELTFDYAAPNSAYAFPISIYNPTDNPITVTAAASRVSVLGDDLTHAATDELSFPQNGYVIPPNQALEFDVLRRPALFTNEEAEKGATAKEWNYNVNLTVTGPASSPITFDVPVIFTDLSVDPVVTMERDGDAYVITNTGATSAGVFVGLKMHYLLPGQVQRFATDAPPKVKALINPLTLGPAMVTR